MKRAFLSVAVVLTLCGCTIRDDKQIETQQTYGEDDFARKKECRDICAKLDAELWIGDLSVGIIQHSPRYAYNSRLNTCIYSGGMTTLLESSKSSIEEKWVYDCLTREKLFGYM